MTQTMSKSICHHSVAALVLLASCMLYKADALRCRYGSENSVAIIHWQKTCSANQTACFQSVKCYSIGDTKYETYDWRCFDGRKCKTNGNVSTATHDGIKGICCFKDLCNAYNAKCTDSSASGTTVSHVSIALGLLLAFFAYL